VLDTAGMITYDVVSGKYRFANCRMAGGYV
jgi:hypothetical protein